MENIISEATKRNWEKLSVSGEDKLKSRANKQKSEKRIIPVEYLADGNKISFIKEIVETYNIEEIPDIIFSLAEDLLALAGVENRKIVQDILSNFQKDFQVKRLKLKKEYSLSYKKGEDFLGSLYQSLLTEGAKNKAGSYYTPTSIVDNMLSDIELESNSNFLDPCCGSGAFLLRFKTENPSNLYGIEKDPIAAFIAKVNLILVYQSTEFEPNIICGDFLSDVSFFKQVTQFDCIATNPPWGNKSKITTSFIESKESFVQFFIKSYNLLNKGGKINFLFPESVLNVKSHRVLREFIISNHDLNKIHLYKSTFTGVTTSFVSMNFCKGIFAEKVQVIGEHEEFYVDYNAFKYTENKVFSLLKPNEEKIIEKVLSSSSYSLSNSTWGLGIVTGNNKEKLKSSDGPMLEKIYTGKEIEKYRLKKAQKYILYDRDSFQQVAKEDIYRAKEKLVYKFVSNKLMFAYDDTSSLFLNSANILIPNIPGMSTKTVLAFLNSSLYQFLYEKLFGELKVLKGNLMELPFPKIDSETNNTLTMLVEEIISEGKNNQNDIDEIIYNVYDL